MDTNSNPKYRQNWIVELLKTNPTANYTFVFAKYSDEFGLSDRTFDKDWKTANVTFTAYQELINLAKLDESIEIEKQAVRDGLMHKNEAMIILSNIARGAIFKINGEKVSSTLMERRAAIQTMGEFEGWKSPIKVNNTHDYSDSFGQKEELRIKALATKILGEF